MKRREFLMLVMAGGAAVAIPAIGVEVAGDVPEGAVEVIELSEVSWRTCAPCNALHGTFLPLGEVVVDHRNGRCDSIPLLKGQSQEASLVGILGDDAQLYYVGG